MAQMSETELKREEELKEKSSIEYLRSAEWGDLAAIMAIQKTSLPEVYSDEAWMRLIQHGTTIVAILNEEVIGYANLCLIHDVTHETKFYRYLSKSMIEVKELHDAKVLSKLPLDFDPSRPERKEKEKKENPDEDVEEESQKKKEDVEEDENDKQYNHYFDQEGNSKWVYVLTSIAVLPEYRKKGIGGRLIEHVLKGYEKVDVLLHCRVGNPSIRLYERHGFQKAALLKGYYEIKNRDANLMVHLRRRIESIDAV